VGLGAPDDAAVWRLEEGQAIVVTIDFFTPVVDNPYEYGAIAAANALSDLYAMGAKPLFALNVAAMPPDLPTPIISEILRGGAEKVRQAGAVVAGGHTVQDKEPKYGLVAIGLSREDELITKTHAQAGDLLVLTKPLGMGVTTTAIKNQVCSKDDAEEAVEWMSKLNETAAALAREFGVRAGTDITGFGLLGHASELVSASNVGCRLWLNRIPFLSGARKYAHEGQFPGGSADNKLFFAKQVSFSEGIDEFQQMLLFDAQTSGGLLLAVSRDSIDQYLERAKEVDQDSWVIGEIIGSRGIQVSNQNQSEVPEGYSHRDLLFFKN
jgi:selenide,water dikinase